MINVEPETEAGSSHDEMHDSSQNNSVISFNEIEEGKQSLSTADNNMFPGLDPDKGKPAGEANKRDNTGKGGVKKPD